MAKRLRASANDNSFYPQVPDCQIASLAHLYSTAFGERESGTFVEIGAYDGVTVSNSYGLAARGWAGILVEPNPEFARRCRTNLMHFPNCQVVETAVGAPGRDFVELHLAGPMTTANPLLLNEYRNVPWAKDHVTVRSVQVPCITLDQLLRNLGACPGFDLLIVDVEGFEAEVFRGFSLDQWKPTMMVIELADAHPDLTSTASEDYQLSHAIQGQGYEIVYKDAINTVFAQRHVWGRALQDVQQRTPGRDTT